MLQAQTTKTQLNQTELMKQFLGNWKAEYNTTQFLDNPNVDSCLRWVGVINNCFNNWSTEREKNCHFGNPLNQLTQEFGLLSLCCIAGTLGQGMQHKSQPSLLINASLRYPILIGTRGFA
jgi:hypothetical protein